MKAGAGFGRRKAETMHSFSLSPPVSLTPFLWPSTRIISSLHTIAQMILWKMYLILAASPFSLPQNTSVAFWYLRVTLKILPLTPRLHEIWALLVSSPTTSTVLATSFCLGDFAHAVPSTWNAFFFSPPPPAGLPPPPNFPHPWGHSLLAFPTFHPHTPPPQPGLHTVNVFSVCPLTRL